MVTIVHLYAKELNIYGDNGNVLTLRNRLTRRGIDAEVVEVNVGDHFPAKPDIIVGGGGQDTSQFVVADDLQKKAKQLLKYRDEGVVMLMVCGTYQLFGNAFVTNDGKTIKGIGVFNTQTIAGKKRLIGNVVAKSDFGRLVGFENHSGETRLLDDQRPMATVSKGAGNRRRGNDEGAITNNCFGTYMHGPLLPKNPHFTDELLRRALVHRGEEQNLAPLNDEVAYIAADIAAKRPR